MIGETLGGINTELTPDNDGVRLKIVGILGGTKEDGIIPYGNIGSITLKKPGFFRAGRMVIKLQAGGSYEIEFTQNFQKWAAMKAFLEQKLPHEGKVLTGGKASFDTPKLKKSPVKASFSCFGIFAFVLIGGTAVIMSLLDGGGHSSTSGKDKDKDDDYGLYTNDVAAFSCAEDHVKDFLKSPSTAEFHPADFTHIDYGDGEWMIKSHVESENGFGAMITIEFEARVVVTDEPSCQVLELYLDGEQVL